MKILAIDPATQLGWAYINTESKLKATHGSESFHNNKWDGAGMRFHKFNLFLHQYPTVDLIVYEAVENHTSTYAAHAYGGWIATLTRPEFLNGLNRYTCVLDLISLTELL